MKLTSFESLVLKSSLENSISKSILPKLGMKKKKMRII